MKHHYRFLAVAAGFIAAVGLGFRPSNAQESERQTSDDKEIIQSEDAVKHSQQWWPAYLKDNFKTGDSIDKIDSLMRDRSICKIRNIYQSGLGFEEYYRIDDFTEIKFYFDKNSQLEKDPSVGNARLWIRRPETGALLMATEKRINMKH